MMTQNEKDELLNDMVREAGDNGRPEWLTQLAARIGKYVFSPIEAAAFLIDNDVTTWHAVASTHE